METTVPKIATDEIPVPAPKEKATPAQFAERIGELVEVQTNADFNKASNDIYELLRRYNVQEIWPSLDFHGAFRKRKDRIIARRSKAEIDRIITATESLSYLVNQQGAY